MADLLAPLIEERAPWLRARRIKPVRSALEWALSYRQSRALAEHYRSLPPGIVLDDIAQRIARQVQVRGLEHVPCSGAALVVANHPTGIADGVVLWRLLTQVRNDAFFYANSDILRVLPQMARAVVPVEWRKEKRSHTKTRATMVGTHQAVSEGRIGVIFPSGRLAERRGLRLCERPWMHSAAMLARKFNLPVIPAHVRACNSWLYYAFDLLHPSLRDITLFHETLNKERQPFEVTFGAPIAPSDLPLAPAEAIEALRSATLSLGKEPSVALV